MYGRGAKAIAREVQKAGIDLSYEEVQEFMEKFMDQFPAIRELINSTHTQVEQTGVIETVWGRRAYYPSVANFDPRTAKQLLAGQKRKAFNLL